MPTTKIAISLNTEIVKQLDQWVREGQYPNRSRAILAAVQERVARWGKTRLREEAARLDRREETTLAEEGVAMVNKTWPEY